MIHRKTALMSVCSLIGLTAFGAASLSSPEKPKDSNAAACFAQLKKLAGDWMTRDEKTGKETLALRYRVTAAGSMVEETELPTSDHEMVTVYHMDGDNLVLTHYCALGNQPHMKATAASTPSKIVFECTGVGNSKSHTDMHMHGLVINVTDANHLANEWTLSQDGKAGHTAKFLVHRADKG